MYSLYTYKPNPWKRQLLVEAGDLDRSMSMLISCDDHRVETLLYSSEHLGISLEDLDDFGVCPLDVSNRPG